MMPLEFCNGLDNHILLRQKRGSESNAPFLLAESTCWYNADARLFEQTQRIQGIWRLIISSCCVQRLLGKGEPRKGIHGSLRFIAFNAINAIEAVNENLGPALEGFVNVPPPLS